ncbi:MAG: hypothetical protein A2X67_06900 [Ignavibacteria bacterium GWA2_55_11]|nr:MAG: hypothetical protein A2X67_06900 [Ignavibacteria bacterium GWA2_55_11]OGU63290.1 MAG: hypothetical protein A3C56_10425 [Ignavibacteria bacterium RIFCSPHIGHO2_02_FULL_56_12]OGU72129.1 MAG: hypothetical protein A3G43_05805 [Ignavibacteria bacterium RIFCSPLOWO2_12_FULL_56_21]
MSKSANIPGGPKMKRFTTYIFLIMALAAVTTEARAAHRPLDVDVRIGVFYRPLVGHGEWIEVQPGVVVWRPLRVRAGWRPYMEGRWVWTDYGWYWVSYEPFGWAVFHYGRWYYDDFYGWVWMPDNVWGPAWVEWRYNSDYIGWAPLSPYAAFHISFGIRYTRVWAAPADYWCFVPYRRFGSVIRYRDYVQPTYVRRLIGTTRSGAGYDIDRDRVVNRGVDRAYVERQSGVRLGRTEIRETGEVGERLRSGRIETYRPAREDFERAEQPSEVRRGDRRLSIDMDRVERSVPAGASETRTRDAQTTTRKKQEPQVRPDVGRSRNKQVRPAPERKRQERTSPTPNRTTRPEVKPTPSSRSRSGSVSQPSGRSSSAPREGRTKRRG